MTAVPFWRSPSQRARAAGVACPYVYRPCQSDIIDFGVGPRGIESRLNDPTPEDRRRYTMYDTPPNICCIITTCGICDKCYITYSCIIKCSRIALKRSSSYSCIPITSCVISHRIQSNAYHTYMDACTCPIDRTDHAVWLCRGRSTRHVQKAP